MTVGEGRGEGQSAAYPPFDLHEIADHIEAGREFRRGEWVTVGPLEGVGYGPWRRKAWINGVEISREVIARQLRDIADWDWTPTSESNRLTWEIAGPGQHVTTDAATGLRFVITQIAGPEHTPSEWEVEQSARGQRTVLDYFPTLAAAVHECNLRAGRTDA